MAQALRNQGEDQHQGPGGVYGRLSDGEHAKKNGRQNN